MNNQSDASRDPGRPGTRGRLAGMVDVAGMPTELKVAYWIWLISGWLGILVGLVAVFSAILALAVLPSFGIVVLLVVLLSLALAVAQIVFALRMKEGHAWARMALTVLVVLILAVSVATNGANANGSWFSFLIGAVATVLMWLPNSHPWFARASPRTG